MVEVIRGLGRDSSWLDLTPVYMLQYSVIRSIDGFTRLPIFQDSAILHINPRRLTKPTIPLAICLIERISLVVTEADGNRGACMKFPANY